MIHRIRSEAVLFGLSVLLVAAAGSTASAATVTPGGSTITPTNGDFGRLRLYSKKVKTRVFTVTKGPGDLQLPLEPTGAGSFVTNEGEGLGFGQLGHGTTCTDLPYLDATHPSCTIAVSWGSGFGPDLGLNEGLLFVAFGADPASDFELPLRGIGFIRRSHHHHHRK